MLTAQKCKTKAIAYGIVSILLCAAPFMLSDFRLTLLSKYLALAILALGIDLIWGYTGILSLGQGVYFGLGAYSMAMYLKLTASGSRLPDFMTWSGITQLPWFWKPYHSLVFALLSGILLPMLAAAVIGFFTFRSRIKGTFFSILSQATVIIAVTLLIGQQGATGGTNGLTNFSTFLGLQLGTTTAKWVFYYVTCFMLAGAFLFCIWIIKSRLGQILVAIRDGENRARFIGYNPASYKLFIYCVSAALAGLSGMLFVFHEGIISPAQMDIVPSIEMVLWVAIGGRGSLVGAVVGAVVTNEAQTAFSESFPGGWLFFLGGLFIVSVIFLPRGIVGLVQDILNKFKRRSSLEQRISHSVSAGQTKNGTVYKSTRG